MPELPKVWTPLELIKVSAEYLAERGVATPRLDAELLLAHVLETDRLSLYLDHARPLIAGELDAYRQLVRARGDRVPLQLLTGEAHLLDRVFVVREGVFIPRPETETLVLECQGLAFPDGAPGTLVELGTGTGCVSILLLLHWPHARAIGLEVDPEAARLTRENARRHGVDERLDLRAGDGLRAPLPRCDLLVSNPPYVRAQDIETLEPEVRDHDPRTALDGGKDGLDVIRELARAGVQALAPAGWLAFEHGDAQGPACRELLETLRYEDVATRTDLAGRPRVTVGRRPA